jgi:hypothetical protein
MAAVPGQPLVPRPTAASVDELVADATVRVPMTDADGKSGAVLERVELGGERYVLKHADRRNDWIMRQAGDLAGWPITVWSSGVLDLMPECIDHTYVGAARHGDHGAVLMRDVSQWLVPATDDPVPAEQHLRFLDHLAQVHAACWGWTDSIGLMPPGNRLCWFSDAALACEVELGSPAEVPGIAHEGWSRLPGRAPRLAATLQPLRDEPWPLSDALAREPHTFLHGDWKFANLGSGPDGRTILIDWALPGAGPPLIELAHYVALNRARLPVGHSTENTIDEYRRALERHGIDTEPWWDRQLALCLLGMMLLLGWEKAYGSDEELAWWEARAIEGAARL